MIKIRSFIWFLPKNLKNNLLFFFGNLLLFSLYYLILIEKYNEIFSFHKSWFTIFIAFTITTLIYNTTFYLKYSKRLGLLLLYGSGKWGLFIYMLLENTITLFLAIIANLFITGFHIIPVLTFLIFIIISSSLPIIQYFFVDIYDMLRD